MKKIFLNFSYLLALVCFLASAQVGMTQSVTVTYSGGSFQYEDGWQLVNLTTNTVGACYATATSGDISVTVAVADGDMIQLNGWESYGDGWNFSNINITTDFGETLYDGTPVFSNAGSVTCDGTINTTGELIFEGAYVLPPCEITAPDDVVAGTAVGTCEESFVTVGPATINSDCSGVPACFEDFESGDVELDMTTTTSLSDTPFSITGVPATTVGPVVVTGSWTGDNGSDFEAVDVELEGVIVGEMTSSADGIDCASAEFTFTISVADYDAAAADGSLDFVILASVDVNSGICASNFAEFTLSVPTCTEDFVNDYNGTNDASDVYPIGETVVTFTTMDANGNVLTDEMTVSVVDLEGPVFANCPSDMTVTLDPGDCNYTLNFDTTALDNCPGLVFTTSTAFCDPCEAPSEGSALACTVGPNSIVTGITLDAGIVSGFNFNQESFGTAPLITVNIYANDGVNVSYDDGVGTYPVLSTGTLQLSAASDGSCVNVEMELAELDAGDYWLEVVAPTGRAVATPAECGGNSATGLETYFYAPACAFNVPTTFASAGFVLDAAYSVEMIGDEIPIENTSVSGNGDALPIGTHNIVYVATDVAGNTSVCDFNVVVNEYPLALQTTTLACNGGVNFSVNADCIAVITPDMVLEGGPYGCYEDFVLVVNGLSAGAISGNGTNAVTINASMMSAFVQNGMVGPFEIEVFDPANGNNSCWNGDFMLEDKLAPIFDSCEEVTIKCTDDITPGAIATPGVRSFTFDDAAAIPDAGEVDVDFEANNGVINDLTVDIDISHTWIGDLTVTLTSPANTSVILYDQDCLTEADVVATFSDAATNVFDCAQSGDGNVVIPTEALSAFNGENSAGTWTLNVRDNTALDAGTFNSVTLTINGTGGFDLGLTTTVIDNCGNAELSYSDDPVEGTCTDEYATVITRTWTAVDAKGNTAVPCVQIINVERETLASVELPVSYDGLAGNNPIISCDAVVLDPVTPINANGQPNLDAGTYGSVGGVGSCGTIIDYYTDVVIPNICNETCSYTNNSYKVIRKWTIYDWCTGEIIEPVQVLKVMDLTAPVLTALPDLTVSTDIWGCGATIELPSTVATDNCTAADDITYTFSSTAGVQVGNTFVIADPAKTMAGEPVVITVTASDCCGNDTMDEFNVSVVDLIPPIVVGESSRTVSLSTDGLAKAFAEDFDDGSHDGCGPIGFFVKRMDNGAPCPSLDKFPPAGNDNAQFNESVHFCCADTGAPVMVQFQVCDDADMNGIIGSYGDNCNSQMVEVIVQDKLAPQIICPAPTTISCIDLAGTDLTDTDLLDELFGTAVGAGTCNVSITQTAVGNENCGAGVIFRNFTATNAAGTTSCQQIITVTAGTENTLTCNRITFAALNNNTYNWCSVNDNSNDPDDDLPALQVDCDAGLSIPEVVIDINGLCTEAGISIEVDSFNFAGGACRKYLVHYEVIDQCIFDENYVDPSTNEIDPYNSDNGYFEFFLEIDAFDNVEPEPVCDDVTIVAENCTGTTTPITITATDNCTEPAFFGYQWRFDIGADNSIDFPASGWVATTSITPGQIGLTEFPIGQHRVFWIVSDGCGNDATCSQLITITGNDKEPTPYCYDGLAVAVMPSTGTVQLWAEDFNAGSFDNCGGDLVLSMIPEQDVDGLGDDAAYNESFQHANVVQLPNNDWGFEFDCSYIANGISAVIEIRVYVTDADGNYDYCTASLRIDDNFDACVDGAGTVTYDASGELKTEQGEFVENTNVTVDASFPEFPMTENVAGSYSFDLIENVDYTITPERNDDHLNGITTLDIVQIQKHILGIETLTSPFQLIAADVNNDCNVTGADLVQLRKLILGKYPTDEFPNNSSWRFVESDFVFTNPQAPCGFSEVADIFNMSAAEANNFVGAKIGDVNATASANFASENETRSNENVEFVVVDNALTAGNTYTVDFLAKDFADVYGFQNTINLTGVEFVGVKAGALNVTENNLGLANIANGTMVVSVDLANGVTVADDAVLFSITVNAVVNANMSDVVAMNSNKLDAQVYVGRNLEVLGNTVVFRTENGEVAGASFELFQNEPNPFNGQTVIGFELPTSSQATISVYDVTGKVLYTKVDGYAKGYNTVTLSKNDVRAVGVLYYKLESGDNVATKKMIVLE